MQFTYGSYQKMLSLLQAHGYSVADYQNYPQFQRCVILRHDIDTSIDQALRMAEVEAELGIKSTYFALLRTDFYNVAAAGSQKKLRRMLELGHDIGLHFDETFYPGASIEALSRAMTKEAEILSLLLDAEVSTVSMHRPSRAMLDADLQIPGLINTYGSTFFHDFKYLSDSRRRWREPVLDIIRGEEYDRLHILTHAFWYGKDEHSLEETVRTYVNGANRERYQSLKDNITDLPSIMTEEEVR